MKSAPGELILGSSDPLVIALNSIVKTCQHFDHRSLGLRHVKVLSGVKLASRVLKRENVELIQLCHFIALKPEDFDDVLRDLIEMRYLTEDAKFGPVTYRLGPMGGTVLRSLVKGLSPTTTEVA